MKLIAIVGGLQKHQTIKTDGVCVTLCSAMGIGGGNISPTITSERSEVCKVETEYRIRKLTPRECWRLMDQRDEDFNKAAEVNSNTQLYKQAGNSIVVNVLVAILGQLFDGKEDVYKEILDKEQPYE